MMENSSGRPAFLDQVAVALSGLCLLHCLALPFFIGLLPFAGQFGEDHFHLQMLVIVVPVSVIAFGLGFRRHRRVGVLVGGAAGLLLLAAGATIVHSQWGATADQLFTVTAATLLAVSHFYNSRLSKRHKTPR